MLLVLLSSFSTVRAAGHCCRASCWIRILYCWCDFWSFIFTVLCFRSIFSSLYNLWEYLVFEEKSSGTVKPTVKPWVIFLLSRSLYAIARPSVSRLSVVCNVRAPYSGDWNFRQCFYTIWYLGHDIHVKFLPKAHRWPRYQMAQKHCRKFQSPE